VALRSVPEFGRGVLGTLNLELGVGLRLNAPAVVDVGLVQPLLVYLLLLLLLDVAVLLVLLLA
jgi:hypothetical protein